MDKKLRLKMTNAFAERMAKVLPEFVSVKMKSMYIWPAEAIWRKDTAACSYFIILAPEPKGQRDEMTIELAWSRLKRFPELFQRPWLVTPQDIEKADQLDEGTIRLGSLCPDLFDWLPVAEDKIDDVASYLTASLVEYGVPFLKRV